MDRTTLVIHVLEGSKERSIECNNRLWLQQNVTEKNIFAFDEDCVVDIYNIEEKRRYPKTIIIQSGKELPNQLDFDSNLEAIVLTKYYNAYIAFVYFPKQKNE